MKHIFLSDVIFFKKVPYLGAFYFIFFSYSLLQEKLCKNEGKKAFYAGGIMEVKIQATSSVDVSQSMREYIQKQVKNLPVLPKDTTVTCSIKIENKMKKFKVLIVNKNYTIRAETTCSDFYEAVDHSFSKIKQSIQKHNKKKQNHKRIISEYEQAPEKQEEEAMVARTKKILPVAMSEESAVLQLQTMDYDFFLYLDACSLNPSIVYYRMDGTIGRMEMVNL